MKQYTTFNCLVCVCFVMNPSNQGSVRSSFCQVNPPLSPGGPYHLFFYAQLAPMNFDVYYIKYKAHGKEAMDNLGMIERLEPVKIRSAASGDKKRSPQEAATKSISNDCFEVIYDPTTNMLKGITDK